MYATLLTSAICLLDMHADANVAWIVVLTDLRISEVSL